MSNKSRKFRPARGSRQGTALATAEVVAEQALATVEALVDQARAFGAASRSQRTRHEYAAQWRTFQRWCAARALVSLPCAPTTLALYLTDRASCGIKPSSLNVANAAIAWHHRAVGVAELDLPTKNLHVVEIFRGIRRTKRAAPRRVSPVVIDELRVMVGALSSSTLIGKRDRALLLVGFCLAARRSELAELRLENVSFTKKGLIIRIAHSKTDQEGVGCDVGVPYGSAPDTCPVRALRAWLKAARTESGPLFRSVKHGEVGGALGGRDVARIVQRTAAAAGLDATAYSGHSLRAGLATSAARAGKTDRAIMTQGRWSSRAMVDRYVRDARLLEPDNAAGGLGL